MVVPLDNRHLRTPYGCPRRTSERSVVHSAGLCTVEMRLEQHFRATGNVPNDSDDVSVWELVDTIELTESEQQP